MTGADGRHHGGWAARRSGELLSHPNSLRSGAALSMPAGSRPRQTSACRAPKWQSPRPVSVRRRLCSLRTL